MTAPITIREQRADCEATIRSLKHDLAEAEASIKTATAQAAGGFKALGSNKEEREAALDTAVADSPIRKRIASQLVAAENKLDMIKAKIEDANEAAQRDRWTTRARFVDVLERLNLPTPEHFFSGADFDRVADEVLTTAAEARLAAQTSNARQQFAAARVAGPRNPTRASYNPRDIADEDDDLFG